MTPEPETRQLNLAKAERDRTRGMNEFIAYLEGRATASRQPALVNQARSGLGPTGFDQAQKA